MNKYIKQLRKELRQILPGYKLGRLEIDAVDVFADTFYTQDIDKLIELRNKHNALLWCDVRDLNVHFRFHSICE